MLPSTTIVKRGLCLLYNISNVSYIFYNTCFKAFLERQVSKDKPTPWLAIKNLLLRCGALPSFLQILHIAIFSCTIFILYKCNCKLLILVICNSSFQEII